MAVTKTEFIVLQKACAAQKFRPISKPDRSKGQTLTFYMYIVA